jgi:hypothetical protein
MRESFRYFSDVIQRQEAAIWVESTRKFVGWGQFCIIGLESSYQ